MSSTNKTTYYELPQFVDNDIFNPLVDDNDAYSKIDTALHNIADAEADDASEIVGIKSRLDSAEGDINTLETQNGDSVLTTDAQTLSGAINELDATDASLDNKIDGVESALDNKIDGVESALDTRLDIVEDDINNASTGLKAQLVSEASIRESADEVLDDKIEREATLRTDADTALGTRITNEITARGNADTALETSIAGVNTALTEEISTRQTADTSLQSQIDQLVSPTGEAPNPAEIENARIGVNSVTYTSLGNAIRGQLNDALANFDNLNDYFEADGAYKTPILFNLIKGSFDTTGFTTSVKRCRLAVPITAKAGMSYHIDVPTNNDYVFNVMQYVDDSTGTAFVNSRYNSITINNFTPNTAYYINFARGDNADLTSADYAWVMQNYKLYYIDSDKSEYKSDISTGDINNYVEAGKYKIASTSVANVPLISSQIEIKQLDDNGQWLVQICYGSYDKSVGVPCMAVRTGRNQSGVHTNNGVGLSVDWAGWDRVSTPTKNKNIVVLGDSIWGNFASIAHVSDLMKWKCSSHTFIGALGGTRATKRDSGAFQWYDFPAIVDAILSGDWSNQTEHTGDTGVPGYFAERIAQLSQVDFSNVDILVLHYGANDFTSGVLIGEVSDMPNVNTYLGALTYNIQRLLTAYPNLRFVINTPCFRVFLTGDAVTSDTDTATYNTDNDTMIDFVEALPALGKKFHSPIVDYYYGLGINKTNYPLFTGSVLEGAHPDANGSAMLVNGLVSVLNKM